LPLVATILFYEYCPPNLKVNNFWENKKKLYILFIFLGNDMVRIWVSSKGTPQALNNLREMLAVTAPLNLVGDCRQIFTQMAEQLYDRLINL
jgi:hypothetical protein